METYPHKKKNICSYIFYKTDDVASMKSRWNPVVNTYQLEVKALRNGVPLVSDELK